MPFGGFLRQSTAVDILFGPCIDDSDGKTAETGLTLDIELSKNGQGLADKNDAAAPVHDAGGTVDGYYNCELDDTDTNTVGQLTVVAHAAGFLPVRIDFQVIEEATYDMMFASGATPLADINAEVVDALATDTYAEPGQEAPGATVTLATKISYIYKLFRNKVLTTASQISIYNDAGDTVDQKSTVSDDGTTGTKGEFVSGP